VRRSLDSEASIRGHGWALCPSVPTPPPKC